MRGWQPIGSGSHTGGSFTIDLTDSGRFPAGTFSMIRLYFDGAMDTDSASLALRVNDDSKSALHQFGLAVRPFSDWTQRARLRKMRICGESQSGI